MWRARPPAVRRLLVRCFGSDIDPKVADTTPYTPRSDPREAEQLSWHASKPYTPVSLMQMLALGSAANSQNSLLQTAQFLHSEVPVRLAKIIQTVDSLPYGLSDTQAPVRALRNAFTHIFKQFLNCPKPTDAPSEEHFLDLCKEVLLHHQNLHDDVTQGLSRDGTMVALSLDEKIVVQPFLDRLCMSRIGNRTLLTQYIALHLSKSPDFVGIIERRCEPASIVKDLVEKIALCLGKTVPIVLEGNLHASFTYFRSHLQYILLEVLTNAMASNVRQHPQGDLPPVKVVVNESSSGIHIKVSDQGGGINRSDIPVIWTHLAPPGLYDHMRLSDSLKNLGLGMDGGDVTSAMHGGLYQLSSLPLCRLYCRYTGGELRLFSMRGYGTDVYIYLRKAGDFSEPIGGAGYSARNKRNSPSAAQSRDVWITSN